jgi:hypothetical protein
VPTVPQVPQVPAAPPAAPAPPARERNQPPSELIADHQRMCCELPRPVAQRDAADNGSSEQRRRAVNHIPRFASVVPAAPVTCGAVPVACGNGLLWRHGGLLKRSIGGT